MNFLNIDILNCLDEDITNKLNNSFNNTFLPQYTKEWILLVSSTFDIQFKFLIISLKDELIGYQPIMFKNNGIFKFANSSPVCGSYGSLLLAENLDIKLKAEIYKIYFKFIDEFCLANNIQIFSIIGNPLAENEKRFYDEFWQYDFFYPKICQINNLENKIKLSTSIRGNIKKAVKNNVIITDKCNATLIERFWKAYQKNREKYGALVFDVAYFENIYKYMVSQGLAEIYYCLKDDLLFGGIVFLKNNNTVCYHEPVNDDDYRQYQSNSFLINSMMEKYQSQGIKRWIWGASPNKECGVYKFKASWGAQDYDYGVYTKLYVPIEKLKESGLNYEILIRDFRVFFIINYDLLK